LTRDPTEADIWFERALDAHLLAVDPFEAGRTELLYGEHLRRTRRHTEARVHLANAVARFAQLGALPWRAQASHELSATGGTPCEVEALAPKTLTPQEFSVARAVADGGSNREVAEALHLSPRTVEYHLGNVYRKLGVHSRTALAHRLDGVTAAR